MTSLVLILVAGGVWLATRAFRDSGESGRGGSSAQRILEERFARGEIDRDEFEERRRTLEVMPSLSVIATTHR